MKCILYHFDSWLNEVFNNIESSYYKDDSFQLRKSESCWTLSEHLINEPFERGFCYFQLFYFLNRIMPGIKSHFAYYSNQEEISNCCFLNKEIIFTQQHVVPYEGHS
jgi:hypothetical protein